MLTPTTSPARPAALWPGMRPRYRTVLVTCTDGGQGDAEHGVKPTQPDHDRRAVAARRSQELAAAAAILGVNAVVELGYPDSGINTDGAEPAASDSFSRRPLKPMVTRLVRLMRRYQPDVVVTYPPNGLSGHPDHIRTYALVVAAHTDIVAACRTKKDEARLPARRRED